MAAAHHPESPPWRRALGRLAFPLWDADAPAAMRALRARLGRRMPLVVLIGLLSAMFEAVAVGLFAPLLALFFDETQGTTAQQVLMDVVIRFSDAIGVQPLVGASCLIVLAVSCRSLAQVAFGRLRWSEADHAGLTIRSALAAKVLALPYRFHLATRQEHVTAIVNTDSWHASDAVFMLFARTAAAAMIALFSVLLLATNWQLFAIACAGVAVGKGLEAVLIARSRRYADQRARINHLLHMRMERIVTGAATIKAFATQKRELAEFDAQSAEVSRNLADIDKRTVWAMPILELVLTGTILAILHIAVAARFGIGATAAFLILLYRMQVPMLTLSQTSVALAPLRSSIRQVEWLLAQPDPPSAPLAPLAPALRGGPLRFEAVSYRHPETTAPTVDRISFTLEPGSVMALWGPSGAGKSTIVNLACRLLEPDAGAITLGGRDIAGFDPQAWAETVAIAGQTVPLLPGTIAQNIAYGRHGASADDIAEAARLVGAHGFISALPAGYDTLLGPDGTGLSEGQRQRIGLARALLLRPEILILDEATSALDAAAESTVLEVLNLRHAFGRAIVISHRPETLRHCTHRIEIEGGRLVAGPDRTVGTRWQDRSGPRTNPLKQTIA